MNLTLKVWRQKNASSEGSFATYDARDVSPDMSFLEMFDVLNERLINEGKEPIAFDQDRKSTRLNSSHVSESRMPSSA